MYRHNVESSDVFIYQAKMFCLSSEQYFLIGFQFVLVFGNNCTQGEYKTSDGQCCPMCNKGLVVRRDCKMDSSTSCIPCIKGTFMNEANGLTKCFPCSPCDPGLGLFIQTQCIETSNTVCDVLDGYYCRSYSSNSECSFAVEHTHCSPGQGTKAPGTKTTDTMCEECQDGFYSQHGANCTAWTEHMIYHTRSQGWLTGNSFGLYGVSCAAMGHVKTKDGNSRQDIVCNNVPSRNYGTLIVPVSFVLTVTALFGFNLARAKLKKEIVEIHGVPVQETEQQQVTSNSPVETAENVPRNVVTDVLLNSDDVP